jgi:hypothetical protein
VGYEQIRVMDELSRNVQRTGGVSLQRQETLGELVKSIAAQRGICRPKNLISQEPTRHEVKIGDQSLSPTASWTLSCYRSCSETSQSRCTTRVRTAEKSRRW